MSQNFREIPLAALKLYTSIFHANYGGLEDAITPVKSKSWTRVLYTITHLPL